MPRRLLLLQSFLLSLLLSFPLILHPFSQAIGSIDGDGPKHVWNLWWMRAEFWGGVWGLRTDFVNYPEGMSLYPIEPLNGILTAFLPLPPIFLSNMLALAHSTLLGLCAGWLGWRVSRNSMGAYVAGALAQGSAFSAFTLHVGVGELRQIWWIPLGLAMADCTREAALEGGRVWRWALGLAACLAGAVLSCFYHGFFLGTGLAIWALLTLRPSARLIGAWLLAAGLSIAVVLPVVRSFSASYDSNTQAPEENFTQWMQNWRQPVETYRFAALDPSEALLPRLEARKQTDRQQMAYTGGRYLGVSTLLLGFLGLIAAPRKALPWVGVAVGTFVLAMGTVPWWHGQQLTWEGGRLLLPLAWINRALSYVAEPLNFPARFLSVTTVALAVLGALACRWRRVWILVPISLIEVTAGDLVPWPRSTFPMPDMGALKAGEGAVFEASMVLKAGASSNDGSVIAGIDPETRLRAMAGQLQLGRPIQGMPVERVDHWATGGMAWARALPLADALLQGGFSGGKDQYRADLYLLRDRGFDRVLLTHDSEHGPPPGPRAVLDALMSPAGTAPNGTLWEIPEVPATPEEATRWREEQTERAAKLSAPALAPQYFPGKGG